MKPLAEVRRLHKRYPVRRGVLGRPRGWVRAVDGVDLAIGVGELVALVGESGSGKTTLGRCLLRLSEPTSGDVRFDDRDLLALPPAELRRQRRRFQMIFQDPYGSLNPRHRIGAIVGEPLAIHRLVEPSERERRVEELLDLVGLAATDARRFPHELSGGQRQRVAIARALASEPRLLVADEPVSALDVSVQAQIVNLLLELRRRLDLSVLFIAHDLALVEQVADRVAVMYFGRIVEQGDASQVFTAPQHPYTLSLLAAAPVPAVGRTIHGGMLAGEVPSHLEPPPGCTFEPRCPIARELCAAERPALVELGGGHRVACHYSGELDIAELTARIGMEQ